MTWRLAALLLGTFACCLLSLPCGALEETEFVRILPSAYVPEKTMTVFLWANALWLSDFHADLYEFVPPGWKAVSSDPPFTNFDPESGTIYWRIDIDFSPFPLWSVEVSYDVFAPPPRRARSASTAMPLTALAACRIRALP